MYTKCLIFLAIFVGCSVGLNILSLYPHSGKSHFMVFEPLFKALAEKGHNITVVSYFPQKSPIPNYRDVNLEEPNLNVGALNLEELPQSRLINYIGPTLLADFANIDCPKGLQNSNFISFLKEKNEFDVILAEIFNTNCFLGLVKKYQAPFVGLSSGYTMPWTYDWLGEPCNPSYVPVMFMDYSDRLSFFERVENTLMYFYTRLIFKYRMEIPGNEFSKKYLGEDIIDNGNVLYNMSLHLKNSHFSLNLPRPAVPADVEVGGIHIGTPKPLPKNLQKWIEESREGVVVFSLGSLIDTNTFPKKKLEAFLKVFKRLPQRILWKWGNEDVEGKPNNVLIQKWLPQFDVLCHPNVKAFISHGGLLGTIEATHCGVPVVVIPQFGDQFTNARALESVGGGVMLKLKDITEDTLYKALDTVLSTEFRQNAKKLSERFKDRPLPPLETAIYWIEYVARHKGAPHMRTAAVDMPFYKYYLIDVAVFLLFTFSLYVYVSYLTVKFVVKKIFRKIKLKEKKA